MSQREHLYRDFIIEASKAYGDANASNERQIEAEQNLALVDRLVIADIDLLYLLYQPADQCSCFAACC
jgi:hypothetical protein